MRKAYPAITASLLLRVLPPMAFGNSDANDHDQDDSNNDDDGDGEGSDDAGGTAAAAAETAAIERQARAQGWRPEADFKGDGKWVDAATFIERGTQHKKALESKVAKLEAAVAESKETNKAFAKFHKEAMEKKDQELTEAIRKARLDHKEAIRNGEDESALVLEDRIDTLKEEKAKLKEEPAKKEEPAAAERTQQESDDAALLEWVEDGNLWFRDDHKLRAYAMAIGQEMRAAGDTSRNRAFLDKIRVQIEEEMPDRFAKGNPLRRKVGAVEGGGNASSQSTPGKTEKDLPKQDRALMQKFVADGLMTKEQFLKDYNWS